LGENNIRAYPRKKRKKRGRGPLNFIGGEKKKGYHHCCSFTEEKKKLRDDTPGGERKKEGLIVHNKCHFKGKKEEGKEGSLLLGLPESRRRDSEKKCYPGGKRKKLAR